MKRAFQNRDSKEMQDKRDTQVRACRRVVTTSDTHPPHKIGNEMGTDGRDGELDEVDGVWGYIAKTTAVTEPGRS